jgi:hypothetical protein
MTISGELSSTAVPRDDSDGPRHVSARSQRGRHDAVGTGAERSVTKTLDWADDDAAQRDYAAALYMLMVVEEESGAELSSEYRRKRAAWTRSQATQMSPM